ncbi:hypothetical protein DACRYDRAFT_119939 [Dacryopinax primogenitus]|uniref:F-box domain-containing protein n=1 Tax=Dacryopinax primogenitus (strain DJM 731) TaxID=1858805 RepID=M5FZ21_DACPD|nr:uncharacterized protein DACRYDRAFT_119939 [Dacryopinax primogenitus]EJT96727.1 hypothetical protein DACRYDRAFT_119939 [Dacryopinax primogenitus]
MSALLEVDPNRVEQGSVPEDLDRKLFGKQWNDSCPGDELALMEDIANQKLKINALWEDVDKKKRDISAVWSLVEERRQQLFALRARRAPVTRLPDDVLMMIFEVGAVEIGSREYSGSIQLLCPQVCRRWRAVACHSPYLWSRFQICHLRSLELAEHQAALHAPYRFGILVFFGCTVTLKRGTLLKRFSKFVAKFPDQISYWNTEIELTLDTFTVPARFFCFPSLSRLTLVIQEGSVQDVGQLLIGCPNLRYLAMTGGYFNRPSPIRAELKSLENLTMTDCGLDLLSQTVQLPLPSLRRLAVNRSYCVRELLPQLPNLVELSLSGSHTVQEAILCLQELPVKAAVMLPMLHTLSVEWLWEYRTDVARSKLLDFMIQRQSSPSPLQLLRMCPKLNEEDALIPAHTRFLQPSNISPIFQGAQVDVFFVRGITAGFSTGMEERIQRIMKMMMKVTKPIIA